MPTLQQTCSTSRPGEMEGRGARGAATALWPLSATSDCQQDNTTAPTACPLCCSASLYPCASPLSWIITHPHRLTPPPT